MFGLATASGHFFGGSVAGDTVIRTTNGGNILLGEGTTERMRIDSSGNVGIGTTSPASKTHIKGGSLTVQHGSPLNKWDQCKRWLFTSP